MTKYFYSIYRTKSSHPYEHIHVNVYNAAAALEYSGADPVLSLEWQGDDESDHWYGFHAKIDGDSVAKSMDMLKAASSILVKIHKASVSEDKPADVINAMGFDRMVRDDRENKWVALDKVKPAEWSRYMSWTGGQCCVSVVAPSEESAVKGLIQEFARNAEGGYGSYAEKLGDWIIAGKPIKRDDYRSAPEIRPLDEILKTVKQPTPVVENQPEMVAA